MPHDIIMVSGPLTVIPLIGHKIVMKAPGPEEVASREEEAAGEDQMDYEVPSLNEQIEEVPGGIN